VPPNRSNAEHTERETAEEQRNHKRFVDDGRDERAADRRRAQSYALASSWCKSTSRASASSRARAYMSPLSVRRRRATSPRHRRGVRLFRRRAATSRPNTISSPTAAEPSATAACTTTPSAATRAARARGRG
jgi:hypothetical protein